MQSRLDAFGVLVLEDLHRQLDESVAACYGWPVAVAQDDVEIVRRLSALDHEIATGARPYEPFATPDAAGPSRTGHG